MGPLSFLSSVAFCLSCMSCLDPRTERRSPWIWPAPGPCFRTPPPARSVVGPGGAALDAVPKLPVMELYYTILYYTILYYTYILHTYILYTYILLYCYIIILLYYYTIIIHIYYYTVTYI